MAKKRKNRRRKLKKVAPEASSSPSAKQKSLQGHPPEQKPPQGPPPEQKPLQRPPKPPLKNAQEPERQESVLECQVCYEPYQDTKDRTPRLLLCGHTFCTTCLSSLIKAEDNTKTGGQKAGEEKAAGQKAGEEKAAGQKAGRQETGKAKDEKTTDEKPKAEKPKLFMESQGDADGQWRKNKALRASSGYGSRPSGSGSGFSGGYRYFHTEPGPSDAPTWRNRQNRTSEQRLNYGSRVDSWEYRRDNIHGRSRYDGQGGYMPNNPAVEVQVRAPTHQDRNSYLHDFGRKQLNTPSNPQLSLQNDPPPLRQQQASERVSQAGGKNRWRETSTSNKPPVTPNCNPSDSRSTSNDPPPPRRQQQASEKVSQPGGKNRGWETVTPNKPPVTQNYNPSDSRQTSNDAKPTETKSTEPWAPKTRKIDKDVKLDPFGKAAEQNANATECNKMQVPSTPEVGGSKTSTGSPARSIACPICRFKTEIGGNGIETCKVNFALKDLIGVAKPVIRCDECLERDASVWCGNCSEPKSDNQETHRTPLASNAENKQII